MTNTCPEDRRVKRVAVFACRVVLGGVFIAAAVSKISEPQEFARAVYQYHLLPDGLVNLVAVFMPWLELVAGCAIIFVHQLQDAAAAVLAALLLGFVVAISANLYRGIEAPCGCFAVLGKRPAGWWHLMADLLLAVISLGIAFDRFLSLWRTRLRV